MAGLSSLRVGRFAQLLAALVVNSCGGTQHGEVLKFWAFGAEADQVSALLPAFEREHPGLHVEVQRLALTAAHEKFLTAVAGDATPDLCQLGNSWIPELVALHALEPLQARVAASKVARETPRAWAAG